MVEISSASDRHMMIGILQYVQAGPEIPDVHEAPYGGVDDKSGISGSTCQSGNVLSQPPATRCNHLQTLCSQHGTRIWGNIFNDGTTQTARDLPLDGMGCYDLLKQLFRSTFQRLLAQIVNPHP